MINGLVHPCGAREEKIVDKRVTTPATIVAVAGFGGVRIFVSDSQWLNERKEFLYGTDATWSYPYPVAMAAYSPPTYTSYMYLLHVHIGNKTPVVASYVLPPTFLFIISQK